MKHGGTIGLTLAALLVCAGTARATEIPVTLDPGALAPQAEETRVYYRDLTTTGLASVRKVTLISDEDATGGTGGVFTGFDLDGVFLDLDGDLLTDDDRVFASGYEFMAGTTRPALDGQFPTAAHPGPVFGSLSANSLDHLTSTLTLFDGAFNGTSNVATSHGFLSLGDGGKLVAIFDPAIDLSGGAFLFVGDVGDNEDQFGLRVIVSDAPEPAAAAVVAIAALMGAGLARPRTGAPRRAAA